MNTRRTFNVRVQVQHDSLGNDVPAESEQAETPLLLDIRRRIAYLGDLERRDGRWLLVIQEVPGHLGGATSMVLPHEAVSAILCAASELREEEDAGVMAPS